MSLDEWLKRANMSIRTAPYPPCMVPGCGREADYGRHKLCSLHWMRWHKYHRNTAIEVWAPTCPVYVAQHQFSLIHLPEGLHWELLYAVQQRHARGGKVAPDSVRKLVDQLEHKPSMANMTEYEHIALANTQTQQHSRSHINELGRILRVAYDEFLGRTPHDRLIWDLVEVGLNEDPTARGGTRRRFGLDFGQISQPWLRDAIMAWARDQTDARTVRCTHRATVLASTALRQRRDHGLAPAALGLRDATAVAVAIRGATNRRSGKPVRAQHQRMLYFFFFQMIDEARRREILHGVPLTFGRDRSHVFGDDRAIDDVAGKAIPVHIQRQLDAQLDTLGMTHRYYREMPDDQRHLMFLTAYTVLGDTGRRTLEVVSLPIDCLSSDANGFILTYDNHKAKRPKRRLPIVRATAEAIQDWIDVRAHVTASPISERYLFPAVAGHHKHLTTNTLQAVMREWVDNLERLDSNEYGDDGEPVAFDRSLIYPYAFRHSYAQRHADNGTPIDVLRDLMDHRSITTTAGYYTITADRKRSAVQTVGKYAIDRTGTAKPLTNSTRYQMRSVAVPFGNCIEPSNVKAGGQSCPIRFQCAGCGFYRPDPSYIPAIQEHLNSLKADRETARALDSAAFVIDNLTAQITAFQHVLTVMLNELDHLDTVELGRLEEAAATLRKARAGALLPLTDITTTKRDKASDPGT
jgi:hypothetical protein